MPDTNSRTDIFRKFKVVTQVPYHRCYRSCHFEATRSKFKVTRSALCVSLYNVEAYKSRMKCHGKQRFAASNIAYSELSCRRHVCPTCLISRARKIIINATKGIRVPHSMEVGCNQFHPSIHPCLFAQSKIHVDNSMR